MNQGKVREGGRERARQQHCPGYAEGSADQSENVQNQTAPAPFPPEAVHHIQDEGAAGQVLAILQQPVQFGMMCLIRHVALHLPGPPRPLEGNDHCLSTIVAVFACRGKCAI